MPTTLKIVRRAARLSVLRANAIVPPPVRPTKWPWHTLKVGESFFVSRDQAKPASIRCAASQIGFRYGKVFTCSTNSAGIEVTRVE